MSNAPAAGHALDILTLLASHGEPMPAAAIARELGLPLSVPPAVLADRGLRHPPAGTVATGSGARTYGSVGLHAKGPRRRARPILTKLVDRTGVNGHFAVLHGSDVLYLIEDAPTAAHRW